MAQTVQTTHGMFAELGIDTRTQEQVLAAKSSEALAKSQEVDGAERFAGDHAITKAGQAVGTLLQQKFGKNKLSDQEQANVDAMGAAQTKFEEAKERGDFTGKDGKPDMIAESAGFTSAVAAELIKIGDPRGFDLAKQLDADRRSRRSDDQSWVKGGLDIEGATESNKQAIYDNERGRFLDKRGEIAEVWAMGETDPNAGMSAFVRDDGTAVTASETEFELGAYTTSRPVKGSGKDGQTTLKDVMSVTDAGKMRTRHRGIVGQMHMAVAMRDALADAVSADGTIEIMGTGGKVTASIVGFIDNVQSIGRQVGKALNITDAEGNESTFDGSSIEAAKYVRENKDLFDEELIPESIRGNVNAILRYQAIIVQFAYGKARLNEDNARISDSDFKHAIRQIGAAATDPEALRQILVGDIERTVKSFNVWDNQLEPHIREQVIYKDARRDFEAAEANFNRAFGQPGGTALQPGPFLTDPQGERQAGSTVNPRTPGNSSKVLTELEQELADLEEQNALAQERLDNPNPQVQ